MEFDGEKILRCTYTKLSGDDAHYDEEDLIFDDFSNCGYEWPAGQENYSTKIVYDGETFKITATAFLFGGLCEAEITDVIMPEYKKQY